MTIIKSIVTGADIKKYWKKGLEGGSISGDEARMSIQAPWIESQIQIACHNIIRAKYGNLKDAHVIFQQNDNGGADQKKKKKAEGTQPGWPDVTIWIYKTLSPDRKHIFVEFKRIGSHKISPEQQEWHDFHKKWNESAYFCNNTVYFEKVICKEIDDFLLAK